MIRRALWSAVLVATVVMVVGCVEEEEAERPEWWPLPYAAEVVSFEPGDGAGYGAERFPDIVLGPPEGRGTMSGSLEVLTLGYQGEIVLGFGDRVIENGDGPDFIVFENAFYAGGDPEAVFAELGEVSVSVDGEEWHVFPCRHDADGPPFDGCAGWTPTEVFDPWEVYPLDPEVTGGDAFDLSDLGLEEARYVRIRDLWGLGDAPLRGFDLDAVGLVHYRDELEGG